jgi:hypothetical protein
MPTPSRHPDRKIRYSSVAVEFRSSRRVVRARKLIDLTAREFEYLKRLCVGYGDDALAAIDFATGKLIGAGGSYAGGRRRLAWYTVA